MDDMLSFDPNSLQDYAQPETPKNDKKRGGNPLGGLAKALGIEVKPGEAKNDFINKTGGITSTINGKTTALDKGSTTTGFTDRRGNQFTTHEDNNTGNVDF